VQYPTLKDLKAAFDDGTLDELTSHLTLDNDDTSVYTSSGVQVFGMHPAQVLEEALDLLEIPYDNA
jgi:hypothetical protein